MLKLNAGVRKIDDSCGGIRTCENAGNDENEQKKQRIQIEIY